MGDDPEDNTRPLPASVRGKMVALASQGLAKMTPAHVPAPLRRSVSFAPAKRARLVGSQITDAVGRDETFREHLAVQVRALVPQVVTDLETGAAIDPAHLSETASVAYILRTDGWEQLLDTARVLEDERRRSAHGDLVATVERLTAALDQARGQVKLEREKGREQVDVLKTENSQLRRTLGQTRVRLNNAESAAAEAREATDEGLRASAVAARAAEAEARRLRARISELESDNISARRAARDERGAEAMRLRLLLDTVMDSASGLRRELALPPSEVLPADTVVALAPASDLTVAGRALLTDDPALLRRLLELPRVHLIVDGYNVSKTAWPTLPLDQQRTRLAGGVSGLTAGRHIEATVVFDGADLVNPPPVSSPRSLRVLFSPPGVIADDLIRQLVEAEPVGRPVVVVSTDRELATSVTKRGARSVAAMALVRALSG